MNLDTNTELVDDLENLLKLAREGHVTNLLYFSQLDDKLLVGLQGDMGIATLSDVCEVAESVLDDVVRSEVSDFGAARLVWGS